MPTRPTEQPTWATDANYAAGSEAWSGTPTRVEPSVGESASGFVPATRPPAQFFNWLLGIILEWIAYFAAIIDSNEEHTYQTPKARSTWVGPLMGYSQDGSAGWGTINGSGFIQSTANTGLVYFPLDFLPTGATITGIEVRVQPGAARATAGNRMGAQFIVGDPVTPGAGTATSIVRDDGTTNVQSIVLTGEESTVVNKATKWYAVSLVAGNTGAASPDSCFGVLVQWTDPGPRNG